MATIKRTLCALVTASFALHGACGSDSPAGSSSDDNGGANNASNGANDASNGANNASNGGDDEDPGLPSDDQTPPMGADKVEAWLKAGSYKDWDCEPDVHASRDPSPHGFNRICSNDLVASAAKGTGDWPKGAAGVKELYASADATTPIGYAVYLKTRDDSAGGANWYWYETIGLDSEAPNVVADGLGDKGPEKSICVGCHVAAGADAAHTPTPGGRDQVYTPVTE